MLAVFSLLVSLAGLEILLAALLANPLLWSWSGFLTDRLRSVYIHEDWSVLQGSPDRVFYDSELLYLLRPGPNRFANREFETTITANSEGLRDTERSLDRPDIVVLGDSYAMGWGVERDQAFPQVLERLTGLEVLNASMSSYGTGREVLLLERLDVSNARAVVVQYFLNDFDENRVFAATGSPPAAMSRESFRSWLVKLEAQQRYRPLDYVRAFFRPLRMHPELETSSHREIAGACLEILASSEELQALPIFFLQIDPWGRPDDNIVSTLTEVLTSEQSYSELSSRFTVVSLEDVISPSDFFLLDPHLRARGHEKVASRIEEALRIGGFL